MKVLLFVCALFFSFAFAQPFHIGVVLSQTGSASALGEVQLEALETLQTQLRLSGGRLGRGLEMMVVDDRSSPLTAATEARRLIDDGVHALLCCTTPTATEAVAPLAERSGIPLLALTPLEPGGETPFWTFGVAPDERTLLQSIVLDAAARNPRLALMTLNNVYGDVVLEALELLLPPGGPTLVAKERYAPNVRVLTPEALLVATQSPGSVIVWGLAPDTVLAVASLERRGYEGPVYINPALRDPLGHPLDATALAGTRLPVAPAEVARNLPRDHPSYEEARRYAGRTARFRFGVADAYGVRSWDALLLLYVALEQTLSYGIDTTDVRVVRGALRDALIGMGPVSGAGAVYNFSERDHNGVTPHSLVIATLGPNGELELR